MAALERIMIKTEDGGEHEALAPVIISASRATDIPAFYAKWFIKRLKANYCVWKNPFNQKTSYVSFSRCKVIVFWTKDPRPLMPLLPELDKRGIHYYFQFTLNDYEAEAFEPNVPPLAQRIETFKALSSLVGPERVIWRFDPIIMCKEHGLNPRSIVTKIWRIGNLLKGSTKKLVFSFVDVNNYKAVKSNLMAHTSIFTQDNIDYAEPSEAERHEIAQYLVKCQNAWHDEGWDIELATCAEQMDLESYGISHNKCIDDELIKRVFSDDFALMHYIKYLELPAENKALADGASHGEAGLLGALENKSIPFALVDDKSFAAIPYLGVKKRGLVPSSIKDKGQRAVCGCMVSKDIGMYNTCNHLCVYCYANHNQKLVKDNHLSHTDDDLSILSMI